MVSQLYRYPNVAAVCQKLQERSAVGIKKYGVTTDREDLTALQWMQHFQEELLDGAVYVQKLMNLLSDVAQQLEKLAEECPPIQARKCSELAKRIREETVRGKS